MGHLRSFGRSVVGLLRSHPILTAVSLLAFVALAGGFVVGIYDKINAATGGKLPASKVASY